MGDPLQTVSVPAFERRHGAGACDCRCRGDEADSEDCCSHAADGGEEEAGEEGGQEAGQEEGEEGQEAQEEEEEEEEGEKEEEEEDGSLRGRQAQEGPAQEQGYDRGGE